VPESRTSLHKTAGHERQLRADSTLSGFRHRLAVPPLLTLCGKQADLRSQT